MLLIWNAIETHVYVGQTANLYAYLKWFWFFKKYLKLSYLNMLPALKSDELMLKCSKLFLINVYAYTTTQ